MTESRLSDEEDVNVLVSFDLPDWYIENIRSVSPRIKVTQSNDRKELVRLIEYIDVLFAGRFSREMFAAAKKLKWIQTNYVGVEYFLLPEVVKSDVVITNASGVNSVPVAEHVMALMLCLTRKLHWYLRNQSRKQWKTNDLDLILNMEELSGKTVGIVGIGNIGTEIASRAKCLGMKIIGTRKNVSAPKPECVDELIPMDNLKELFAQSDFVVLQLPLTKETTGIIGEPEITAMKRTAYLINTGRGLVIQEDRLIQALKDGRIAGAALDTFVKEPLPQDSPLWEMENVVITPHVAGLTPLYGDRLVKLFCENLKKYVNKEPLINVIDKSRGY